MSVLQSQISPLNQQLLQYYLSKKDYKAAANQYLAGLHNLVAHSGSEASLSKVYTMVPKAPEDWSEVDRATLLIFQASSQDKSALAEAKKLLESDTSDLGKSLRAYCEAQIGE